MADPSFEQKLNDMVSGGYVSLAISMGFELGLFDHVTSVPQKASQIAASAGYKERYVEEWLKSLAISDIIETNNDATEFWIAENREQYFSKTDPLLIWGTGLPVMAEVYYHLMECFKQDGPSGLPFKYYAHFSNYMSKISSMHHTEDRLISGFMSIVPNVIEQLRNGGHFLDVGCGQGGPSFTIAKAFPNCQSFGIDHWDVRVEHSNAKAKQANLSNLHFQLGHAHELPKEWSNTFDYATLFNALHEEPYPEKVLGEILRVLKPGGHLSLVDTNTTPNIHNNKKQVKFPVIMQVTSLFHCVPVGSHAKDGAGLGMNVGKDVFSAMAKKAGFVVVNSEIMPDFHHVNFHLILKKPE